jgi:hypothetical protein
MTPFEQLPDYFTACLTKNWARAAGLIALLARVIRPDTAPSGGAYREALRLLRLTEGMIRRLLVIEATKLTPPKLPTYRAAPTRKPPRQDKTAPQQPAQIRPPLFRLTEPRHSLRSPFEYVDIGEIDTPQSNMGPNHGQDQGQNQGPRIRLIGFDSPADIVDTAQAEQSARRLLARFTAAQNVLAHRDKHAARMARWIAAARAKNDRAPTRLRPLRFGRPPGAQKRPTDRVLNDALLYLNDDAHLALDTPPPP